MTQPCVRQVVAVGGILVLVTRAVIMPKETRTIESAVQPLQENGREAMTTPHVTVEPVVMAREALAATVAAGNVLRAASGQRGKPPALALVSALRVGMVQTQCLSIVRAICVAVSA